VDCGQLRAGLLRIAASRRHSALTVDSDPGLLRTLSPVGLSLRLLHILWGEVTLWKVWVDLTLFFRVRRNLTKRKRAPNRF